jgi:hypothetical protein
MLRRPGHLLRVIKAKARVLRALIVPINMGQQTLFLDRVRTDDGIDDEDRDVRVVQGPAVEEPPPEENNPDAVGLRNRPNRSVPNPDPAGAAKQAKLWKIGLDGGVLFFDRRPCHQSASPKNLCCGATLATTGLVGMVATAAGMPAAPDR